MGNTKWNPLERTSFSFKPFHNCYLYVTAERQNNISFFPWTALQKCTCLATGTTSRGKRAILHAYQQLKVTLSEKFLLTDFCFNIQFWDVISLSHVYFFLHFHLHCCYFIRLTLGCLTHRYLHSCTLTAGIKVRVSHTIIGHSRQSN